MKWGWTRSENQLYPNSRWGGVKRLNRKYCLFWSQSIDSIKLNSISKNQLPRSMRRARWRVRGSCFFQPWKKNAPPPPLNWKFRYADFLGGKDVPFGSFVFSQMNFHTFHSFFGVDHFKKFFCYLFNNFSRFFLSFKIRFLHYLPIFEILCQFSNKFLSFYPTIQVNFHPLQHHIHKFFEISHFSEIFLFIIWNVFRLLFQENFHVFQHVIF